MSGATIPGLAVIPSACVGATVAACKSALTAAGFTATPTVTTLSTAAADLTKPAGNVVTTTPAPNTQVDTATVVTIQANPNPLPLAIPDPLAHETYQAYIARLQALG